MKQLPLHAFENAMYNRKDSLGARYASNVYKRKVYKPPEIHHYSEQDSLGHGCPWILAAVLKDLSPIWPESMHGKIIAAGYATQQVSV